MPEEGRVSEPLQRPQAPTCYYYFSLEAFDSGEPGKLLAGRYSWKLLCASQLFVYSDILPEAESSKLVSFIKIEI